MKHKVLTVKQPWAFLICSGIKDIENRTWKCPQKYIGQRVLIHASAKKGYGSRLRHFTGILTSEQIGNLNDILPFDWMFTELNFSAIIGSVEIVDCVLNHPSIWADKEVLEDWTSKDIPGKYSKPVYNWVVADPILFDKPILGVKGKLSFWDYDLQDEYVELINEFDKQK